MPRSPTSGADSTVRSTGATRHRVARLAQCILAALLLSTLRPAPVSAAPRPAHGAAAVGGIGLQLRDVPVAERNDPRDQIYIVEHVAPGSVIHARIEVSNTTASSVHIVLFSAGATIANGSFLGDAGHTADTLSTWTSARPGSTELPAGGRQPAVVTIAVPRDAVSGEQYAVVWAEARSAPSRGVVQVNRVGIRIYLSVGVGAAPASNFAIESLTAERSPAGEPMVLATVDNTGELALDMYGTLELSSGPGGTSAGPFPARLGTTLGIGESEPVTIVLGKQLPDGPWNARVTLSSGLLEHSATAIITFPAAGASSPVKAVPARPRSSEGAIVGVLLVLLLLLGVAVLVVALRRRRRRSATTMLRVTRSRDRRSGSGRARSTVPSGPTDDSDRRGGRDVRVTSVGH